MEFAKVFETEEAGQLMVKRDSNEEGEPEVRVYFKPKELGVCSIGLGFEDTDEGFDSADLIFSKANKKWALGIAIGAMKDCGVEPEK